MPEAGVHIHELPVADIRHAPRYHVIQDARDRRGDRGDLRRERRRGLRAIVGMRELRGTDPHHVGVIRAIALRAQVDGAVRGRQRQRVFVQGTELADQFDGGDRAPRRFEGLQLIPGQPGVIIRVPAEHGVDRVADLRGRAVGIRQGDGLLQRPTAVVAAVGAGIVMPAAVRSGAAVGVGFLRRAAFATHGLVVLVGRHAQHGGQRAVAVRTSRQDVERVGDIVADLGRSAHGAQPRALDAVAGDRHGLLGRGPGGAPGRDRTVGVQIRREAGGDLDDARGPVADPCMPDDRRQVRDTRQPHLR